MAGVQVEVRGMDRAIVRINGFGNFPRSALMAVMAETVRRQTIRRFTSTKTAPDGAKWKPLAPATMTGWGGRKGSPGDILVDTGTLRNSISSKVAGNTAMIGTGLFYAKFHQRGTRRTDKHRGIPARPFMGLGIQDQSELKRIVEAFVGRIAG